MTAADHYNAKQIIALDHLSVDSDVEEVVFGGGIFGGKTFLGCDWQIKRRLKYPKTRGLIGRSSLKELQLSTMLRFWEICNDLGLRRGVHYNYNGQYNIITWFNGSETILMDMADMPSDPLFMRFGSLEITDFFLDEASEISQKAIEILGTRVRYNLVNGKPKGLLTCNPSKGYLYREFYDPHRKGTLPEHRKFVESLMADNTKNPDPVYRAKMERLPEQDRKRLLEGDWDYDESKDRIFEYSDLERMFSLPETTGQMYTTADIAAMGDDETIIGVWCGLSLLQVYIERHKLPHEVAAKIREINTRHKVPMNNTIVDSDGLGIGVYGILKCKQFLNGGRSTDPQLYENMRAECYFKLAELVRLNRVSIHIRSEQERITRELDAIRRKNMNSEKKLSIIPREQIIKALGNSPDRASMIMMRMYFELKPNSGVYRFGGG